MAERDGLRSVTWKRVPVWTMRVGRWTAVVTVMRKLVKREDVEMADARNQEGGDGDEEDHGEEDGNDWSRPCSQLCVNPILGSYPY